MLVVVGIAALAAAAPAVAGRAPAQGGSSLCPVGIGALLDGTRPCDDGGRPPQTSAPASPAGLMVVSQTDTTLRLSWSRARGEAGLRVYELFLNGTTVGLAISPSFTFGGLRCSTSYTFGVRARDLSLHRSATVSVPAATSACPATPTANLWVDTDGGTCTRSSAPVAHDDAAACGTLGEAYAAALAGDTVNVSAGTYRSQTIREAADKNGAGPGRHVQIQPNPGDAVTIQGIQLGTGSGGEGTDGPDHLTLAGFVMPNDGVHDCDVFIRPGSSDVTLDGVTLCSFGVDASHDILIQRSSFGPCAAGSSHCMNSRIEGNGSTNVQIVGNRFHDYTRQLDSEHFECMVVWGVTGSLGLVVRGNRFSNCAVLDLALYQEGEPIGPALVENNFFALPLDLGTAPAPYGQAAINLKDADPGYFTDLTIRFNSFGAGTGVLWTTVAGGTDVNTKAVGNIFGNADCSGPGVTYAYNAYLGKTCGGTGEVSLAALPYLGADDFHLLPGVLGLADRLVPAAECPLIDIDGDARLPWLPCDAGADER